MTLTIAEVLAELDRAGLPKDHQDGENGVTTLCPLCPSMMSWVEGWPSWICDNPKCPSQESPSLIGHELHFLSSRPFNNGNGNGNGHHGPPEGSADAEPDMGRRVVLTPASTIAPERVRWLDKGRIPLNGVFVVAGEPGLGKSTYTGASLPAAVTRGLLDGDLLGEPRDVLIASAEDSWGAVVVPRLMAAGADLSRVHRVEVRDTDGGGLLTLPDDVSRLEAECRRLRERGRAVGLLVVDPIGAFLAGSIDSHRDASVRRAIAPLADLTERERLALGVVSHLNKNDAQKLLSRITGSGAFGAAARSVLGFARDPDDRDGEKGSERVIVHCKSNWGRFAPTIAARVEGRYVDLPDGDRADVGFLLVTGESDVGPEDLQRGRDEHGDDCEEAIIAALTAFTDARESLKVKEEVSTRIGCSLKTVERHAVRMRDRGDLVIEKAGFPPTSTWTLAVGDTPSVPIGDAEPVPNAQTRMVEPKTGDDASVRDRTTGRVPNGDSGVRSLRLVEGSGDGEGET